MIVVTAVRVFPFDTGGLGGNVKAYAEVEIDGCLLIKGLKVLQTEAGGYWIGYPSRRARRETYVDVVVPDKEAARIIREAVMTEYRRVSDADREAGAGDPAPLP